MLRTCTVGRCPLHGAWRGPRAAATKCRSMCPPHSRDSIGVRTAIVLGSLDAASRSDQQLAGCASQRTTRNVNHRACTHDQQARGNVPCNAQQQSTAAQRATAIRGRRARRLPLRYVVAGPRTEQYFATLERALLAKLWAHRTAPHRTVKSPRGYHAVRDTVPRRYKRLVVHALGAAAGRLSVPRALLASLRLTAPLGKGRKAPLLIRADVARCMLHAARCMLHAA
jgi:hypothetical protein